MSLDSVGLAFEQPGKKRAMFELQGIPNTSLTPNEAESTIRSSPVLSLNVVMTPRQSDELAEQFPEQLDKLAHHAAWHLGGITLNIFGGPEVAIVLLSQPEVRTIRLRGSRLCPYMRLLVAG